MNENVKSNSELTEENELIQKLRELFRTANGRDVFLAELNLQRSVDKDLSNCSSKSFQNLISLINLFLNACLAQKDARAASIVMIMSQTFSRTTNGKKFFLQNYINEHRIWSTEFFWDEIFLLSVAEEVRKNCPGRIEMERKGRKIFHV